VEFNCGVHILRARFQVKIFIGLELVKQVFYSVRVLFEAADRGEY
jgi:hypothetical protein